MQTEQAIYLVTGNSGKFVEFRRFLPQVQQLKVDLEEIQSLDIREIITAKLQAARRHHTEGMLLVEDTSLALDCLDGLPGPFIKWFEKIMGIRALAEKAEKLGNTRAIARTVIGILDENNQARFFEGELEGDFVSPRGMHDFGWGPSFQPKGMATTFGEMSREEKDNIGMRGLAIKELIKFLQAKIT